MRKIMQTVSDRQVSAGLALLRAVVGFVFVMHGAQKLFVWGIAGVQGGFAQMGIPMAAIAGPAIAVLEFGGGILLIAGLLTRPIGALLAATMLVALALVHLPAGFFMPDGYAYVLTLFGGAGALVATGAGAFSLDAVLANRAAPTTPVAVPASRPARAA